MALSGKDGEGTAGMVQGADDSMGAEDTGCKEVVVDTVVDTGVGGVEAVVVRLQGIVEAVDMVHSLPEVVALRVEHGWIADQADWVGHWGEIECLADACQEEE